MLVNSSKISVVSTGSLPSGILSANLINLINKNEKNSVFKKSNVEFVSLVMTNTQVLMQNTMANLILLILTK